MCCCDKPTVNGELGYKWQPNDKPSIRPVDPPSLSELDTLRYDEPGRCGGVDSHCHHYRVVGTSFLEVLYKHGAGEGRIRLANSNALAPILAALDSNARYWMLNAICHAYQDGAQQGSERAGTYWRTAAIEKRIKVRRMPKQDRVKVWIEPKLITAEEGRD